jgi:autotransporter-associated beta strand protein
MSMTSHLTSAQRRSFVYPVARFAIAAVSLIVGSATASAQTLTTYNGGAGSGLWSAGSNWTSGTPTNSGTFGLTFSGSTLTTSTNDIGAASSTINVSSLTFTNNGANATAPFALNAAGSRTLTLEPNALITGSSLSTAGTSTLNLGLVASGTVTFDLQTNHRVNVNSTWTGTGTLIKNGPAELALFASVTPFDTLQLNAGTLTFGNAATQDGAAGKVVTVNAGTINVATGTTNFSVAANGNFNWRAFFGQSSTSTAINFNTPTATGTNLTITLQTTGTTQNAITGTIRDNLTSTVALSAPLSGSSTFRLTGSNSYTGGTTLSSGTLSFATNSLGTSGSVRLNGGTLRWESGNTQDISSRIAMTSGSTATLDTNGNNVAFASGIGGSTSAALTKLGAGMLTLSGSNTYTGPTTVSGGTLAVNGILGSGSVSVAAATWLQGSGTIGGPVNVQGTLSPGSSPGVLTVGSVVLGGPSTTLIEIDGVTRGTQYDGVNITGTSNSLTYGGVLSLNFGALSPNGTTYDIFNFTGGHLGNYTTVTSTGAYAGAWDNLGSGTFQFVSGGQTLTFSQSTGDIIVVPEPAGLAAAGLGIAAIAGAWKRRSRHAAARG